MKNGFEIAVGLAKDTFFDSEKVLKATTAAERRTLSRLGAFTRRTAKSSLKYRPGSSPAGSPPHVHKTGMRTKTNKRGVTTTRPVSLYREWILFGYDVQTKSVVVGPTLRTEAKHKPSGDKTVPEIIERGGTVQGRGREITITVAPTRDAKGRFRSEGKITKRLDGTVTYKPRPAMRLAFEKEVPQFLNSLKDSVK